MKKKAQSFQDLIVWQKAHQFVLGIYGLTKSFPDTELYGLTSQLRRSANFWMHIQNQLNLLTPDSCILYF